MQVNVLNQGKLENVGTIRLVDNVVKLDIHGINYSMFINIEWRDKKFTPEDGVDYLQALKEKFSLSTAIVFSREEEDKSWLK